VKAPSEETLENLTKAGFRGGLFGIKPYLKFQNYYLTSLGFLCIIRWKFYVKNKAAMWLRRQLLKLVVVGGII
jgi:hypothetical protein